MIPDLIAKLVDSSSNSLWKDVPELFRAINQQEFNKIPDVPPGTWTGKIKLVTNDGRRLVVKDGKIRMTTDSQPANEVVFAVLDADMKKSSEATPTMNQVRNLSLGLVLEDETDMRRSSMQIIRSF